MRCILTPNNQIRIFTIIVHHDRTRHVEVDRYFIEKIENGVVCLIYVSIDVTKREL